MSVPNRSSPINTRRIPAIRVATSSPLMPYSVMIPSTMTMKAPVGPPICTELPPSAETTNPPMTAVISPTSGETPLAMAKAIAIGRATIPTMSPARRSRVSIPRL